MTEKRAAGSVGQTDPAAATEIQDEVKDSTNFKVKNFTSSAVVDTNDDNITIREELKSLQKSIALFKQDIRKIFHEELFKFLNEGQQQKKRLGPSLNNRNEY